MAELEKMYLEEQIMRLRAEMELINRDFQARQKKLEEVEAEWAEKYQPAKNNEVDWGEHNGPTKESDVAPLTNSNS